MTGKTCRRLPPASGALALSLNNLEFDSAGWPSVQ